MTWNTCFWFVCVIVALLQQYLGKKEGKKEKKKGKD